MTAAMSAGPGPRRGGRSANLERTQRKTIPVRPRVIGRPAPGFEVAEVACDPALAVVQRAVLGAEIAEQLELAA